VVSLSKRVLLIDDEDDIREVAGMSLETVAGWTTLAARSGREGLKIAAEQQPDAILLDVMMPDMDGPSTFRNLQESAATRSIPVIFLTAKAQTREQRGFRELGAHGVISKPFDPLTLADQISELLGWK
jgi:CheY-like chemotaxis protein